MGYDMSFNDGRGWDGWMDGWMEWEVGSQGVAYVLLNNVENMRGKLYVSYISGLWIGD